MRGGVVALTRATNNLEGKRGLQQQEEGAEEVVVV